MNPNPHLELIYNGLVKNNLIDTTGGYDYNQFENWIGSDPNNLNTIYDSMIKNNLIDNTDGSYTFDKFNQWVGNVDINKQDHLEKTKEDEEHAAAADTYTGKFFKALLGHHSRDKEGILDLLGIDPNDKSLITREKVGALGMGLIGTYDLLGGFMGHGGAMAVLTAEGTYDYLKNEDNRGTISRNIASMTLTEDPMMDYIRDVQKKGLDSDQSPISTLLNMMNTGTPEEKEAKTNAQLLKYSPLSGTHTLLKYLINGLAVPVASGLLKDTDLSPYYNNEKSIYIEHLAEQSKIGGNVDKSTFEGKGIGAFLDPAFYATEFSDGLAFFAAAFVQGAGTKLATKAVLTPIAASTAYGASSLTKVIKPTSSLASFDKAHKIARNITDKADIATGVTVMSIGEAGMEAQNVELSMRPLLEEKYGKLVKSGEMTPEEAFHIIESELDETKRETFLSNMGLLLFTNGIELSNVMRSFKPKTKIDGVDNTYIPVKKSIYERGKSVAITGTSEAFEENMQAAISAFEENKRIYDQYDDYGINVTRILGEGVKGLSDPATQRAMLIGFALGGATQTISEYGDYKKVKKYYDEIQPEQLKDAQILGLNSIKSLYTVDADGKVIIDEVAKKNFLKSYMDHKNDVSFLERALEGNDTDLIDFAHTNLLSKFIQRSLEGGADVATTLAGVESVLNAKYDPAIDKSKIQEVDSDGSVITFAQFKEKKLKIAERAVATHQYVEKIAKSKGITDIKHKADLFDAYNKYQFLDNKVEELESEKSKIEDIELEANQELINKLDSRILKLNFLKVGYGARINDLTRDSSIKSRKKQSIIENIKLNSKDEEQLKANLQTAVQEGVLDQSDVDKVLNVKKENPLERSKDDTIIDLENQQKEKEERSKLFQLKKTELEDKYGVTIYDNLDGTFEQIKPVADTEVAISNAQQATKELEELGFVQVVRTQEEGEGGTEGDTKGDKDVKDLTDIDELSDPTDLVDPNDTSDPSDTSDPVQESDSATVLAEIQQKVLAQLGITRTNKRKKLCAADGLTDTVQGSKWKIVKDFKGQPKHSQGGVDISISSSGVSMRKGGKDIKAAHGLVLPSIQILQEGEYVGTPGQPSREEYVSNMQSNMGDYLNEVDWKSPYFNDGNVNTETDAMNCINGVCTLISNTSTKKFKSPSGTYTGNMTFQDNAMNEGYYQTNPNIDGFGIGDVFSYGREKGNPYSRFTGKVTPRNTRDLVPTHSILIADKTVDEGITYYRTLQNSGEDEISSDWLLERELIERYNHGMNRELEWGFDGAITYRYDPDKVSQIKLEKEQSLKVFDGDNEFSSQYDSPPKFTFTRRGGLENPNDPSSYNENIRTDAKDLDKYAEIYNRSYETIGKGSNIPRESFDKLIQNQIGIARQESKLGKDPSLQLKEAVPNKLLPAARKLNEGRKSEDNWKLHYWKNNIEGVQEEFDNYEFFIDSFKGENDLDDKSKEWLYYNSPPSKGIYQQKELSERGRHYGLNFDNTEEQAMASLSLAVDNYHVLKKKYPNLSNDEIIDLTTLMHNAPSKALEPRFVNHYLKNNDIDYVNKIKRVTPDMKFGENKPRRNTLIQGKQLPQKDVDDLKNWIKSQKS